jgi:hypothetical protein
MGIVSMEAFSRDPMLKGARYSGIHKVVYPIMPDTSTSSPPLINVKPQTFGSLVEADTVPLTINSPLREQYVDVNQTIPYIHPVLADDHYVLRSSFYERTPSMSLLEALTADYILATTINFTSLRCFSQPC